MNTIKFFLLITILSLLTCPYFGCEESPDPFRADSDGDSDTDIDTDANSDTNANSDADADSDTDTDADTDADGDKAGECDLSGCESSGGPAGAVCSLDNNPCDCDHFCTEKYLAQPGVLEHYCAPLCDPSEAGSCDKLCMDSMNSYPICPVCLPEIRVVSKSFDLKIMPLGKEPAQGDVSTSSKLELTVDGKKKNFAMTSGVGMEMEDSGLEFIAIQLMGIQSSGVAATAWSASLIIPKANWKAGTLKVEEGTMSVSVTQMQINAITQKVTSGAIEGVGYSGTLTISEAGTNGARGLGSFDLTLGQMRAKLDPAAMQ